MAETTILTINGYRDEPVPNHFLRPREARDHLAILLPGFGCTLDMPLFYYAENLLLERGWNVLRVEYAYNQRPEFHTLPEPEQARWLHEDATAAYHAGLSQRSYQDVVLVGKSLGTLAMGHLLTAEKPAVPTRAVWLTPLLTQERLRQQIVQYRGPSLFVIGSADPYYDATSLEELRRATNGEAIVIDAADHGMDISGDPIASVRAVEQVVAAMVQFF